MYSISNLGKILEPNQPVVHVVAKSSTLFFALTIISSVGAMAFVFTPGSVGFYVALGIGGVSTALFLPALFLTYKSRNKALPPPPPRQYIEPLPAETYQNDPITSLAFQVDLSSDQQPNKATTLKDYLDRVDNLPDKIRTIKIDNILDVLPALDQEATTLKAQYKERITQLELDWGRADVLYNGGPIPLEISPDLKTISDRFSLPTKTFQEALVEDFKDKNKLSEAQVAQILKFATTEHSYIFLLQKIKAIIPKDKNLYEEIKALILQYRFYGFASLVYEHKGDITEVYRIFPLAVQTVLFVTTARMHALTSSMHPKTYGNFAICAYNAEDATTSNVCYQLRVEKEGLFLDAISSMGILETGAKWHRYFYLRTEINLSTMQAFYTITAPTAEPPKGPTADRLPKPTDADEDEESDS